MEETVLKVPRWAKDWLEVEGLWRIWLANSQKHIDNFKPGRSFDSIKIEIIKNMQSCLDSYDMVDFLNCSFQWSETSEGWEFWDKVSTKAKTINFKKYEKTLII